MADSENSRTLPAITCRNSLETAEWFLSQNFSEQERWAPGIRDAALTKWDAWWAAFRELRRLGHERQELESRLEAMAAAPKVEIKLSGVDAFVASSIEEIQQGLRGDVLAIARASAEAEFVARCRRWESVGETVGYRRAKRAELQASGVEEQLAAALSRAPAMTTVAAACKLHCILERSRLSSDHNAFPWPQIRSVLIDILAMNGVFSMGAPAGFDQVVVSSEAPRRESGLADP